MRGMKLHRILYAAPTTPPHKHSVQLSAAERRQLRRLVTSGTATARTITHARILLKADAAPAGPAWTDAQVAAACETSPATITRVRRAFVSGGLDAALHRKPTRRQYHRVLDGRQEAQLVALSCSTPPAGQARWSLRLLTERFIELEGAVISDETVRRVLKKTRSSHG
jgi:transposase